MNDIMKKRRKTKVLRNRSAKKGILDKAKRYRKERKKKEEKKKERRNYAEKEKERKERKGNYLKRVLLNEERKNGWRCRKRKREKEKRERSLLLSLSPFLSLSLSPETYRHSTPSSRLHKFIFIAIIFFPMEPRKVSSSEKLFFIGAFSFFLSFFLSFFFFMVVGYSFLAKRDGKPHDFPHLTPVFLLSKTDVLSERPISPHLLNSPQPVAVWRHVRHYFRIFLFP